MAPPFMQIAPFQPAMPQINADTFAPVQNALMRYTQGMQQQQQRNALLQGLQGMDMSDGERQMLAANPQMAQQVLGKVYADRFDPMAGLNRQMKQAELEQMPLKGDLLSAQAHKARQEARTAGEQFGKAGSIFQDKDGMFYSIQFGSNGQRRIEPLTGLAPSRGVATVDTGTGTAIIDKSTGKDVRSIDKDIAGAAQQKEVGEARGKAIVDVSRVGDNAARALQTIQQIRQHPGKQWGVGAAGILPGIPGTQQRGFVSLVNQAKGQVFLEAFNSLRGGGAITEKEGAMATEALARLDRAQRPEDFEKALSDLESVVVTGLARAERSAGKGGQAQRTQSLSPGTYQWTPDGGLQGMR